MKAVKDIPFDKIYIGMRVKAINGWYAGATGTVVFTKKLEKYYYYQVVIDWDGNHGIDIFQHKSMEDIVFSEI